jgi:hypothetical protein
MAAALGSGAPRGNKNALKHGRYTYEALERRRQLRALLRQIPCAYSKDQMIGARNRGGKQAIQRLWSPNRWRKAVLQHAWRTATPSL